MPRFHRSHRAIMVVIFSFFALRPALSAQHDRLLPSPQGRNRPATHSATGNSVAGMPKAGPLNTGTPLFLAPVDYNDLGSWTVEIADLNGDGKPDLVVVDQYGPSNQTIGVFMGNGDETFQPEVQYDSGGSDYYAAQAVIADVNGDGKPDVIVVNEGFNGGRANVGVLLGNGDGSFQSPLIYVSVGSPDSVAVADLNGDGKLDLVVGGCCDQRVAVGLGNGDGTFQPAVSFPTVGYYIHNVAIADVTGDGKLDILVTGSSGLGISRGNGDGTFQPAVILNFENFEPNFMTAADLNDDGKTDLILTPYGPGGLLVLLGNGNGTFQTPAPYSIAGAVGMGKTVLQDVDGDGKADLFVLTSEGGVGTVGLLMGNGDGTFQPATTYDSGGASNNWLAVADFNGDGKKDVVVSNSTSHSIGILMNSTGPRHPTITTVASSVNPANIRQLVTYTATVSGESGKPLTRGVSFSDEGSTGIVPLAGNQATYTTSYAKVGVHSITATYVGDVANLDSTSPALSESIARLPVKTVTTLTTTASPTRIGQNVTFKATVAWSGGNIPDGEPVVFEDGTKVLATVAISGGLASYTTSVLAAKAHTIRASYAGNATFRPSFTTLAQSVELYSTTIVLHSSQNPSTAGQSLIFTATVTSAAPSSPTGKVLFKDGTRSLASKVLIGGVATLIKSNLTAGSHSITATYEGDPSSAKSTSSALTQVVN